MGYYITLIGGNKKIFLNNMIGTAETAMPTMLEKVYGVLVVGKRNDYLDAHPAEITMRCTSLVPS